MTHRRDTGDPRDAGDGEGPHRAEGRLAPELARRLEGIFRALDPELDAGACTDAIARGLAAPPPTDPALLTVVVRNHTLERLALLDEALFSLACSEHRPLEVLLSSQAPEADAREKLEELLERHASIAGPDFSWRLLHAPDRADRRGRLANAGFAAARGRYLALLDDDDVVYPSHHARLVEALRGGDASWAIGRARRVAVSLGRGEPFVLSKAPWPAPEQFDLVRFAADNYVPVHAFVLDRDRLAGFRIAFPEHVARQEDYLFLLRLASLFRPVTVAGPPTCEYRFRDDGSNTTPAAGAPLTSRLAATNAWESARSQVAAEKQALQVLLSPSELAGLAAARPMLDQSPPLRHRIADALNDAVKRAPRLHSLLKATFARRSRR